MPPESYLVKLQIAATSLFKKLPSFLKLANEGHIAYLRCQIPFMTTYRLQGGTVSFAKINPLASDGP